MTWLTWRQFRGSAAMVAGALVALCATLALTGPGMSAAYSTGLATCNRGADCARFFDRFFDDYDLPFLAVTIVVLILPALVGLFWGAPLITRELEAGTHLLVWNQSITRTRWLAVKLALTGLTATAAAGLCGLAVTWWSGPLDKAAAPGFALMDPLVFGARGIAPMGYAAFAFVLGATVGILLRRTLPAMAVTLAVFVAVQLAVPFLVRPYVIPPVRATFELDPSNVNSFGVERGGSSRVILEDAIPGHTGAWVLSSRLLDPSGRPVDDTGTVKVSTTSGPCSPSAQAKGPTVCLDELNRIGYRQAAVYQPLSRFWALQWIETGIYAVLSLGLIGLCFRWIRRRVS